MLPRFRRDPLSVLQSIAREYGDITYFRLAFRRLYFINRPDLIEEVLVTGQANFTKSLILRRAKNLLGEGLLTSEGQFHTRQRRLMQPAFYRERLAGYAATMVSCAERSQTRWSDGETIDIAEQMMRLTLSIVGLTLFNKDVEREAGRIGRAMTSIVSTFDTMLLPMGHWLQHLPFPRLLRARWARSYLDRKIYKLIRDRRLSGIDEGDLLSTIISAASEEDGRMTDRQVRDEALTLLLAGHETTATALAWTWYLLSKNPEAEQRFHAELETVLAGRPPTYEDLRRLEYTERVFSESLRLYPPAWAIGRMAIQQVRLFNYLVPRGAICVLSPYVMHRHPRFWPDAERFDPDRFTPAARAERPRYAYFPFGGGARVCLGERFARMEGVLLLAAIGQRWRFRLAPDQVIEPHPQITLRPRYGMRMIAERI